MSSMHWLDQIKYDDKGLVPVIAQEQSTGDVLMFAWMNREALQLTAELKRAVYFSNVVPTDRHAIEITHLVVYKVFGNIAHYFE